MGDAVVGRRRNRPLDEPPAPTSPQTTVVAPKAMSSGDGQSRPRTRRDLYPKYQLAARTAGGASSFSSSTISQGPQTQEQRKARVRRPSWLRLSRLDRRGHRTVRTVALSDLHRLGGSTAVALKHAGHRKSHDAMPRSVQDICPAVPCSASSSQQRPIVFPGSV